MTGVPIAPVMRSGRTRGGLLAADRLTGLDAARGLAIAGMLVVHLTMPGGPALIPAGRSAALFAVAAGASLGLLSGGAAPPPPGRRARVRASIVLRGVAIALIGLALWQIPGLPFAVILDVYGALFVVLAPVLFARRRVLLPLGLLLLTAGSAVVVRSGFQYVPPAQRLLQLPQVWFVTGEYPGLTYGVFVLMGLIAARSDLRSARTLRSALALGVVLATVGYGGADLLPGQTAAPHSDTAWEVLGDGGVALAVIALLQLLAHWRAARVVLLPLAAPGSMPLTVYVLQVVAVLVWPGSYLDGTLLVVLLAGSSALALLWRRFVGRGPLEQAVALVSLRR